MEKEEPQAKRIQRKEEEEPQAKRIQRKEEEEPQAKRIQRMEEEEPQAKRIQRKEEEEPQAKRIQRMEEEEPQAKRIQRKEEEEPQAKRIQRMEEEPQAKRIQRKEEEEPQAKRIHRKNIHNAAARSIAQPKGQEGEGNQADSSKGITTEELLSRAKGKGSPLPDDIRLEMEQHFGADFSKVRIHTGPDAVTMTQNLNAYAFAQGYDIFFNQGQFDPYSKSGKHLLAHELTHVVQQKGTGK